VQCFGWCSSGPVINKDRERISEIAIELGKKIKVIGSTDLTHYGPNYAYTVRHSQRALDWVKNHKDRKMVDLLL
jgi:AmmeMemoRadiSam system protein B